MKHRMRSADLTEEDWLAWIHARHGFHGMRWLELIDIYESSDRIDADLMWAMERHRQMLPRGTRRPIAAFWCFLRGEL